MYPCLFCDNHLNRSTLEAIVRPFYTDCLTVNSHSSPSDVLGRILSEDFVSVGPQNKSKAVMIGQIQHFWNVIPDLKWQIEDISVDGNKVVVRSLATGSPRGDFMGVQGLDGSKSFAICTIDIHTVVDGQIKCVNHLEDWGSAIQQLQALVSGDDSRYGGWLNDVCMYVCVSDFSSSLCAAVLSPEVKLKPL
jgi:predicted ester cyclase